MYDDFSEPSAAIISSVVVCSMVSPGTISPKPVRSGHATTCKNSIERVRGSVNIPLIAHVISVVDYPIVMANGTLPINNMSRLANTRDIVRHFSRITVL